MLLPRRTFVVHGAATIAVALIDHSSFRVEASGLDYEVPGEFPLLKQLGDTCWATTATMMYNWKNKSQKSVNDLVAMAGEPYAGLYARRAILPFENAPGFFSFLGLRAKPPASFPPETIDSFLRTSGILWATTMSGNVKCPFSVHARIIRGIHGNDALSAEITVVDPATGMQTPVLMTDFYREFENFANAETKCDPGKPLDPQILYF